MLSLRSSLPSFAPHPISPSLGFLHFMVRPQIFAQRAAVIILDPLIEAFVVKNVAARQMNNIAGTFILTQTNRACFWVFQVYNGW